MRYELKKIALESHDGLFIQEMTGLVEDERLVAIAEHAGEKFISSLVLGAVVAGCLLDADGKRAYATAKDAAGGCNKEFLLDVYDKAMVLSGYTFATPEADAEADPKSEG